MGRQNGRESSAAILVRRILGRNEARAPQHRSSGRRPTGRVAILERTGRTRAEDAQVFGGEIRITTIDGSKRKSSYRAKSSARRKEPIVVMLRRDAKRLQRFLDSVTVSCYAPAGRRERKFL